MKKFRYPNGLKGKIIALPLSALLFLSGCKPESSQNEGFEVRFTVGSNLAEFCEEAAKRFNNSKPKLNDGQAFYLTCQESGSGDVVNNLLSLARLYQAGSIKADARELPSLLSVDGEIYQSQLIYQMDKIFPGQSYIPAITDSPLIAYSPMVFMTDTELASGLQKVEDPYTALVKYSDRARLNPNANAIPIYYVHTAPTRSNSGLQTLVAQFASIAGKPPERLSVADVEKYQPQIQQIQSKIVRYGVSTSSLANSMVKNGVFWASVGSVYESSVISANNQVKPGQTRYQAVYPKATFSSNIRAILLAAPWVSPQEKEAAEKIVQFLRSPQTQQIAVELGLRPGVPGVSLGAKFSPEFGIQPNPIYESYRPPRPEVVEAMLKSWQNFAKKPSLVAVVVDTSGSMENEKLTAVQNTLFNYVKNLGPKEKIALIRFSSKIDRPVIIEGTKPGRDRAIQIISGFQASGGTRLYDSALYARNWLLQNFRSDAINAVLLLTDGEDSGSKIDLNRLQQELQQSGFSSDRRIAFFTIGYGNRGEFNPDALQKIAEFNGGYYREGNPETITNVMADLQVEF